ncbi:meiosis-specific nuclear structural protein 1-like [Musca vetustissima]|uniref:meiosis-specific nuclear structural protein 1-like n=1 Tax=Musca vetustissima TaxID=27455 RepID=UPI002AB78BBD|nr:meiosis-specific nuclear structural protein 1-like [Musca vetustissima]
MTDNPACSMPNRIKNSQQNSSDYFHKYILDEEKRLNHIESAGNQTTKDSVRGISTSDICQELKQYKKQILLDEKRRQQLRNNNHELRLLQNQLQTALVSKQLQEQMDALQKQRQLDTQRRREENAQWEMECEKAKRSILEEEERERQRKTQARTLLQEQMHEVQSNRKKEFEKVMKDREDMQKTQKQIEAEEQRKRDLAQRFRDLCRKEMEECMRLREVQRQLEKEQNVDDNERLMAYQRERDELKEKTEAENKRIIAEKMALSERIGKELANINKEREKRDDLLLSLLVEERKAKEDIKYRQMLEKQIEERTKLRMELENYRREIAIQKQRKFAVEERQMREESLRQMAERDKLDQLSDEKRRRKIMEHNRALKEMIEQRRQQRAEEIAHRIGEFETMLRKEKERDQCIEEERIRMLQSIPTELLRYLPPGVLKPSDREHIPLPTEKST